MEIYKSSNVTITINYIPRTITIATKNGDSVCITDRIDVAIFMGLFDKLLKIYVTEKLK